jgi:hypothetical protein
MPQLLLSSAVNAWEKEWRQKLITHINGETETLTKTMKKGKNQIIIIGIRE